MDRSRPLEERKAAFRRRHDWERFVARPTRPPTLKLMVTEWPNMGMVAVRPGPGRRGVPVVVQGRVVRRVRARAEARVRSGSVGAAGLSRRRWRPGRMCGGRSCARRWAGRRPVHGWALPADAARREPAARNRGARWTRSSALACSGPTDHFPAYANRSRWGSDELETADFVFNPLGHGWHVRRPAFDAALLDAVRTMGVRVVERRLRGLRRPRS